MNTQRAMENMETFLAYAIALEEEAAERYEEQADALATHNNPEVAELFQTMTGYCREHAEAIKRLARDYQLPDIAVWDFEWDGAEAPETTPMDAVHYLMTPAHALQLAMDNERRAYDFYHRISQDAANDAIKKLAAEFAEEEKEHLDLLKKWADKYPPPPADWHHDHDPAHMPE